MKIGDNIEIYNDECLKKMQDIEDGSIDMILCDLPYGTTDCSWDNIIPFDKLWEQYKRIIKPYGIIALFGSEPFSSKLRMSNIQNFKYDWIWDKKNTGNPLLSKVQPRKIHEIISIFYYRENDNSKKYKELREYFINERNKSGLTNKDINELIGKTTASHFFTMGSQFQIPSKEDYKKMQTCGFFQRDYEDIKKEFYNNSNDIKRRCIYYPQGIKQCEVKKQQDIQME